MVLYCFCEYGSGRDPRTFIGERIEQQERWSFPLSERKMSGCRDGNMVRVYIQNGQCICTHSQTDQALVFHLSRLARTAHRNEKKSQNGVVVVSYQVLCDCVLDGGHYLELIACGA